MSSYAQSIFTYGRIMYKSNYTTTTSQNIIVFAKYLNNEIKLKFFLKNYVL